MYVCIMYISFCTNVVNEAHQIPYKGNNIQTTRHYPISYSMCRVPQPVRGRIVIINIGR